MGQLRDGMVHDLELAGYVPKTRLSYINAIREFAAHFRRSPGRSNAPSIACFSRRSTRRACE